MSARLLSDVGLMLGQIPISPLRGGQKVAVRILKLAVVQPELDTHSLPQKVLRARALMPRTD